MKFKSAVDRWCYFLMFALLLLLATTIPRLLSGEIPADQAIVVIVSTGLPLWCVFSTCYRVSDDLLLIRSGPFFWKIKLADIHSARLSRSILSSPALSLNRIELRYRQGKKVLVSPENQEEFLRAIGHARPTR